jgi:uncharacterized membrane protein
MSNTKLFTNSQSRTFLTLVLCTGFSFCLLILRIKIAHSFFYSFLIWNLFLAVIPFALTTILNSFHKIRYFTFAVYFCIWLVFLPNAPYIVTDLVHLRHSSPKLIWLDVLMVNSFALSGLLFFYFSMEDMLKLATNFTTLKHTKCFSLLLCFLSAFGVYLGRFLRYNSWEVIQNPTPLLNSIIDSIVHPITNADCWLFTLVFGIFLNLGYWTFKTLRLSP